MNYFSTKASALHRFAVSTQPLVRYALTVFMLGGFFYGWYTMCYGTMQRRINRLEQELIAARVQRKEEKTITRKTTTLEHTISSLTHELHQSLLPSTDHSQEHVLETVLSRVQQGGLVLQKCSQGNVHNKVWCKECSIDCELQGSFGDIITLLAHLDEGSLPIMCSHMRINQQMAGNYSASCSFMVVTQ